MTRILFATVVLILFSKPEMSFANTTLKLTCDLHTYQNSKGDYHSKDKGDTWVDGSRFLHLEFGDSYKKKEWTFPSPDSSGEEIPKLDTDMSFIINTNIIQFFDNGSVIKLTTAVDSVNRYYTFNINRMTGRVTTSRIEVNSPPEVDVHIYECQSAKMKF